MGYNPRCKACTHVDAELINDMLRRRALGEPGVTFDRIIEVIEERGGELSLSSLSRHSSRHFDVMAEGRKRAAKQYDEAADTVAKQALSDVGVLDAVIQRGVERLEANLIQPDVKDTLNAIKVKHGTVMKDENPIETLLAMVSASAAPDGDDDE